MGNKRGKPKEPMPEWWGEVDKHMLMYLVWERIIIEQQNLIDTLELGGTRIVPAYRLREDGKNTGGHSASKEEIMVVTKIIAQGKIDGCLKMRADMDETVRIAAAGDKEKEAFIRLYWMTTMNRLVKVRKFLVITAPGMDFLATKDWHTHQITGGNRTFYDWRADLYKQLGMLTGHWEGDNNGRSQEGMQDLRK